VLRQSRIAEQVSLPARAAARNQPDVLFRADGLVLP
jgi:hypothetical protein